MGGEELIRKKVWNESSLTPPWLRKKSAPFVITKRGGLEKKGLRKKNAPTLYPIRVGPSAVRQKIHRHAKQGVNFAGQEGEARRPLKKKHYTKGEGKEGFGTIRRSWSSGGDGKVSVGQGTKPYHGEREVP